MKKGHVIQTQGINELISSLNLSLAHVSHFIISETFEGFKHLLLKKNTLSIEMISSFDYNMNLLYIYNYICF